jgi:hypothetical protein
MKEVVYLNKKKAFEHDLFLYIFSSFILPNEVVFGFFKDDMFQRLFLFFFLVIIFDQDMIVFSALDSFYI